VDKPLAAPSSLGIYGFPGALSNARAAAGLMMAMPYITSHHITSRR